MCLEHTAPQGACQFKIRDLDSGLCTVLSALDFMTLSLKARMATWYIVDYGPDGHLSSPPGLQESSEINPSHFFTFTIQLITWETL